MPHPAAIKLRRLTRRAAELAGLTTDFPWDLEISFVNDRAMAVYNEEIVGHTGTTDVITMSYFDDPEGLFPGDIALELIVNPFAALREGTKRPGGYAREIVLYIVHGMLHAAGEDDLDPVARRRMRKREREVMSQLAVEYNFEEIFPECKVVENAL